MELLLEFMAKSLVFGTPEQEFSVIFNLHFHLLFFVVHRDAHKTKCSYWRITFVLYSWTELTEKTYILCVKLLWGSEDESLELKKVEDRSRKLPYVFSLMPSGTHSLKLSQNTTECLQNKGRVPKWVYRTDPWKWHILRSQLGLMLLFQV